MTDQNSGRLMAAAPDLLAAAQKAVTALWEIIGQEDLQAAYKDKLTDLQTDLLAAIRSANYQGEP
jgi:hypothetical protein